MFKLDDLLSLFPNEKTKEMLVYSYYLSQVKDKDLSNSVFEMLLSLKRQDPSIDIIFDTTKDGSHYNHMENTIYINSLSIEVFLHELTHLLSYNYLRYQIPQQYYSFREIFLSNEDNQSLIVGLLNMCKRSKDEILQKNDNKTIIEDNNKNVKKIPYTSKMNLISCIEDIIDSIYDGHSFSYGIKSIKDNNSIAIKAQIASGHGCDYFSYNGFQFEEILADYLAIKLTDPNNELFVLLKNILGIDFIDFLDQRCYEICGQMPKIETNSNISKK